MPLFVVSAVFLVALLLTLWIHNQYHLDATVPLAPPPAEGPLISVVVPARNEERNIRSCIRALGAQTYSNLEIIVVDDESTDATREILAALAREQPGLRVITGEPLPPGWAGKPHALWQGATAAAGEWLCFIDADTRAAPELIAATHAAAERLDADLLSILTFQELVSFWEKVVLPLVFTAVSVGHPARKVNDPQSSEALANGQFILIRRRAYQAVGGHAAVQSSIVEDKDLARLVKHAGFRLIVADGRHLARTRMYTSFGEIWSGWTKNIYYGIEGRLWLLTLGVIVTLFGGLGLPLWLIGGGLSVLQGAGWQAGVIFGQGLALYAAIALLRARVLLAFGASPLYGLTFPLGALVFAGMMAASSFSVRTGRGITWKGRIYRQDTGAETVRSRN